MKDRLRFVLIIIGLIIEVVRIKFLLVDRRIKMVWKVKENPLLLEGMRKEKNPILLKLLIFFILNKFQLNKIIT